MLTQNRDWIMTKPLLLYYSHQDKRISIEIQLTIVQSRIKTSIDHARFYTVLQAFNTETDLNPASLRLQLYQTTRSTDL